MATDTSKRAVGVFPNSSVAETALHELKAAKLPMKQVPIITRDNCGGKI